MAELVAHQWPDGVTVRHDGAVLEVAAAPMGRTDVAVIVGIVVGVPAVVVLLFPTWQGAAVALLFAAAVLGLGYHRIAGMRRLTVDVAAARIDVGHVHPRLARRLRFVDRTVAFTDVMSVDVTRIMPAARTEPHGRRVSLRLRDDTTVVLTEFTAAVTGITFADAVARLIDVPMEER